MKIEDRNWKGRLTKENIEAVHNELKKMFSEAPMVVVALTNHPIKKYLDAKISTGETLTVNMPHEFGFSINSQNYIYPIHKGFLEIRYDRFIYKDKSLAGNNIHWEFVQEKGEHSE